MSEYRTGVVFRGLALVPFPGSSDFGCCLKSELENPKLKTGHIWFKWPKGRPKMGKCRNLSFDSLDFGTFGFQTFGTIKTQMTKNRTTLYGHSDFRQCLKSGLFGNGTDFRSPKSEHVWISEVDCASDVMFELVKWLTFRVPNGQPNHETDAKQISVYL